MIAKGIADLHGETALKQIGVILGVGDSVSKNTVQNALRRLMDRNVITKIQYGVYQFEDDAFADWIKYRD